MIKDIQRIFSIDSPGIECYASLKRPSEHFKKGLFVMEGDKVMERFLATKTTLVSVLFTEKWFEIFRAQMEKRPEPVTVFLASKENLATIVGYNYHHGVMGVAVLPTEETLICAVEKNKMPQLFVALDGLDNAENVGVVMRNCAACGVQAVVVGETAADPYLRQSVRSSMGTVFKLQIVRTKSLCNTLIQLKTNHGFQVVAAHPDATSASLYDADLTKPTCIVLGNEGNGISQSVLDVCDYRVRIPMAAGIDSFNVACASAIFLCEVNRQREMLAGN